MARVAVARLAQPIAGGGAMRAGDCVRHRPTGELQERVDVAEAAADATISDAGLALRTIAAWLTSPHCDEEGCVLCARDVEIAKGILDGDWLGGADDADHDRLAAILSPAEAVLAEARDLLRRVVAPLECDDEADFGATKADALDTEIGAFLARVPAGVGS